MAVVTRRKGESLRQYFSGLALEETLSGLLFAAPFLVGFAVFIAYPMLYSIVLVFQNWDLLSPPVYVGFSNVAKVFRDPVANLSLYNTAYYAILAVPIQLVISFLLAMALNQPIKARSFYRAGFYMPMIVPVVASAVVWQRVFHPEFGLLNEVIGWAGIPAQKWLWDPALAKPSFIFMSFWMIGRQMVIFIAGLQNIPQSLLEAASIDGAGRLRQMRHIIIPLMTPIIFYNMVMAIIASFQIFAPAMLMTAGGPQNATLFAVLNIYRNAFEYYNMGYASALAWELFLIVIGFTITQFYVSRRWVYYETE